MSGIGLGLGLMLGATSGVTVPPVSISPTSQATEAGLQYQFTATNGSGAKTWSIVSDTTGGASVNSSGLATAGPNAGTFSVRVTDSSGHADAACTNTWTPRSASITSLGWWRADVGVTIAASKVTAWQSFDGRGDTNSNATQATGAKQPPQPAVNAKLNNQMSIPFGAAQGLVTGVLSTAPANPVTVLAIFSDGSTGAYLIDSLSTDTGMHAEVQNSAGFLFGGSTSIAGSAYDANGHAFLGLANGASSSERKDNMTTTDVAGAAVTGASGFTLGADKAISSTAAAKIAELAVWNGNLSATDKTNLRTYLQTRYALTIGA